MRKVLIYINPTNDLLDEELITLTLKIQQAINLNYNIIFFIAENTYKNNNALKDFIETLPTSRYTILPNEKDINYKEIKFSIIFMSINNIIDNNEILFNILNSKIYSRVYITFNKYIASYKLNSYKKLKDFYYNFIDRLN